MAVSAWQLRVLPQDLWPQKIASWPRAPGGKDGEAEVEDADLKDYVKDEEQNAPLAPLICSGVGGYRPPAVS